MISHSKSFQIVIQIIDVHEINFLYTTQLTQHNKIKKSAQFTIRVNINK